MASLNNDQLTAASHKGGHALVLAGPGTGKTSTLVARHSYLKWSGVDADGIVCISFTKEAAEEIKRRLGESAPARAWIGTFHGICLRLLKRFNVEARLAKNFKVLDPSSQRALLYDIGVEWDQDDGDLTDIIGRWKDSLVSPSEAEAEAVRRNNVILRKAAKHFALYEEELDRRGHLDFADLLVRATRIIESSAKVKTFIAERMPHFLVDEFQDVNRTQIDLLLAVIQAGSTLWAVADDDQAIYGWRGGKVAYTLEFERYFPGAKRYFLMTNYRCDPAIIAAANTVIQNNKKRVSKSLKPARAHNKNSIVRVRSFRTDREEADWVAKCIKRMLEAGIAANQIGVLFRTSSVTAQLQQAFEKEHVPFSLSGVQSFWDQPEVVAMTDLLLAVERGDVGRASRFKGARDIVETMKGSGPPETAMSIARLIADQPTPGLSSERQSSWIDTCYAVADLMREFETAEDFKSHVMEMTSKSSAQDGGVSISTMHSSKGLEWKHVFVIGCEQAMMPHQRADDIEEERRLFYVALTRSKGAVQLSLAKQRFGKAQQTSAFISELARAPREAVKFLADDILDSSAQATGVASKNQPVKAGVPPKPGSASSSPSAPKVYILPDGRRSLIPPEGRD